MRTLIVDDQSVNRIVLHKLLVRFGPCEMAADGPTAIAAWTKAVADGQPFDLICLDIRMPGMNGHQVLAEIRKVETARRARLSQQVKVFMVSALGDEAEVTAAFCEGCTAFIPKSVTFDLLLGHLVHIGLISREDAQQHTALA